VMSRLSCALHETPSLVKHKHIAKEAEHDVLMLHALYFTPSWASLPNVINIREEYNSIRVV